MTVMWPHDKKIKLQHFTSWSQGNILPPKNPKILFQDMIIMCDFWRMNYCHTRHRIFLYLKRMLLMVSQLMPPVIGIFIYAGSIPRYKLSLPNWPKFEWALNHFEILINHFSENYSRTSAKSNKLLDLADVLEVVFTKIGQFILVMGHWFQPLVSAIASSQLYVCDISL